jgi:hypothetical protein
MALNQGHFKLHEKDLNFTRRFSPKKMNLTPRLSVNRAMEQCLLLLICGLLLTIFVISVIPMISTISCIDLLIILLLLQGPLATRFKEPSLGLGGLNAYVSDCEKICHCFGLLHGDLLNSLNVTDPVMKGIDDFDVLDVQFSVPGIIEIFHVVLEAFIMLLLDGLQDFSCRRMLVHTLKVPDEHGT